MAAPLRNRFAAKPQDEQHSETLYVRLKKQDKDRIVEAAGETGIAAWAREVLLSAAASKAAKAANQTVQRRGASRLGKGPIRTSAAAGSRR
jgi:hypothetical protein